MRQARAFLVRALLGIVVLLSGTFPVSRTTASTACAPARVPDDATASTILATQRSFKPVDKDLFISYVNPVWEDATPPRYPNGPAPTPRETKAALRRLLERRFPCSPQRVLDGLAVFDNPMAELKIPDPTLRAALVALTGTFGEPAISFILFQAPVAAVFFGVVINYGDGFPTGKTATAYAMPEGTWNIVIDGLLRYNSFASLSALLFHEALHVELPPSGSQPGDLPDGVGLPEEATAVALESLIYMQMLLADPTIAHAPDAFTRGANNHAALVRLNSGEAGTDHLNIFLPDNRHNIDPLTVEPLTEFYGYYAAGGFDGPDEAAWTVLETHGNALLQTVLPSLAEPGNTAPDQPDYDRATLDFLDQNQAALRPGELIAVACILELDVSCAD